MTKLQKFMDGYTRAELAKRFGIDPSHVGRVARGARRPSPDLAKKIVKFSKGRLTLKDVFSVKVVRG